MRRFEFRPAYFGEIHYYDIIIISFSAKKVLLQAKFLWHAAQGWIIIGQVVSIHIDEAFITNSRFETAKVQPLARCAQPIAAVTRRGNRISNPNQK